MDDKAKLKQLQESSRGLRSIIGIYLKEQQSGQKVWPSCRRNGLKGGIHATRLQGEIMSDWRMIYQELREEVAWDV